MQREIGRTAELLSPDRGVICRGHSCFRTGRAEHLAYLFCAIDRRELFEQSDSDAPYTVEDRFTNQSLKVDAAEFVQLFEIEIANFVEQVPDHSKLPQDKLEWYISYFGRCRSFVSEPALAAYEQFFGLDG